MRVLSVPTTSFHHQVAAHTAWWRAGKIETFIVNIMDWRLSSPLKIRLGITSIHQRGEVTGASLKCVKWETVSTIRQRREFDKVHILGEKSGDQTIQVTDSGSIGWLVCDVFIHLQDADKMSNDRDEKMTKMSMSIICRSSTNKPIPRMFSLNGLKTICKTVRRTSQVSWFSRFEWMVIFGSQTLLRPSQGHKYTVRSHYLDWI